MKKNFFLFIFIFIFITSCGFQPLYQINNNKENFKVNKIQFTGNKNISKKIYLRIPIKLIKNDELLNKLTINSYKDIAETSKNSSGQVESYRTSITMNFILTDYENKVVKEITLNKDFLYSVTDNKFKFKEYQMEIENNLINKIREDLIIFLNS